MRRSTKFTMTLVLCVLFAIQQNLFAQGRQQDSLALVALYNSTNGASWTDNTNWLSSEPINTWFGVVQFQNDRVTQLNLNSNNLTGTLPPEITNLTALTNLRLWNNDIGGPLPAEIDSLANLEVLFIHANQFTGTIPAAIGNLPNLRLLYLSQNLLTGSIPDGISNLTNLTHIYLHTNSLSGSIPDSIGKLVNLQRLYLNNNQLSGTIPSSMGLMTSLDLLFLTNNQLSGAVPPEFENIDLLENLHLDYNRLVDLPALNSLDFLSDLYVAGNLFTFEDIEPNLPISNFVYAPQDSVGAGGDTTVEVGSEAIVSVDIGGNFNQYQWRKNVVDIPGAVTDTYIIPAVSYSDSGSYSCRITNTQATALTLYSRPFNLHVIPTAHEIDSLALVALYNSTNGAGWNTSTNWLTTEPIENWHGITLSGDRVTYINLGANNLTGTLPEEIGDLTSLMGLSLYINNITVPLPSTIANLTNLDYLTLNHNQLTGPVPAWIWTMSNLEQLNFRGNDMSGTLPPDVSNMTSMTSLMLGDNQFSGSIPAELADLPALQSIQLHDNQFSGVIPDGIGNIATLTSIYMENNLFSGAIPADWGNLTSLFYLYLSNNQLTGAIPSGLANNTNLEDVHIDNNLFDTFPDLSALNDLTTLHMQNNRFTFEDIEPNIGIPHGEFLYSPQDSAGLPIGWIVEAGISIGLEAIVGGVNNQYQWYKGGVEIDGATSSTYMIDPVDFDDAGVYICHVTNTVAVGLTIVQRPITLTVIPNYFEQDSLALVEIYNSCGGASWTNNTSWLTSEPLNAWTNLALEDGRVTELNLSNNNVTGSIPTAIGDLTALQMLSFRENTMSGNIPPEIGNMSELRFLDLAFNDLSGEIPEELGDLSNLVALIIDFNHFNGEIPASIGNLENLEELFLGGNWFEGSLPDTIGYLSQLRVLHMHDNQLSGPIPASITNLTNLESVRLEANHFTDLPDISSLIPPLQYLNLEFNRFGFDDIESYVGLSLTQLTYIPQDSVGETVDTVITVGSDFEMNVTVGGSANLYQWYKDGVEIPGAGSSQLILSSVDVAASGSYICEVTNTIVADLAIYSHPVHVTVQPATGLADIPAGIPGEFSLYQNYPNPFNPSTTIRYDLPQPAEVMIKIYNIFGQEIRTLVAGQQSAGYKTLRWDGKDQKGRQVAGGIYFYRILAGNFSKTMKMVLIK